MPTILDSIKAEQESGRLVIRMIRAGEFFRAYNKSAWLCTDL